MPSYPLTVTGYTLLSELPDPFLTPDNKRITSRRDWASQREYLKAFAVDLQYGTVPPAPEFLEVEPLYTSDTASTYQIITGPKNRPVRFTFKLIMPPKANLPASRAKPPVIVDGDLCFQYAFDREWLNTATDAGIAWALFDRTQLAHDIQGEGRRQGQLYDAYPAYTFGALGAWAWGYSRVVDALELLNSVDMDCVVFTGHSRGGKTAALAGALDTRAAIVNPNETCAGACGCYRIHMTGSYEDGTSGRSETLYDLWTRYGYWMGPRFGEYADNEANLPFDCHWLKALVAPRTLFISEATSDFWANPVGSWQTTLAAREVYEFLGAEDELFWYFRPGKHCHTVGDVSMLVRLILRRIGLPFSDEGFFNRPFEEMPLAFDWRAPKAD